MFVDAGSFCAWADADTSKNVAVLAVMKKSRMSRPVRIKVVPRHLVL
jgi:hypothetical protein